MIIACTILGEPLLRLGTAQPMVRLNTELDKYLINRDLLKVDGIAYIRLGR